VSDCVFCGIAEGRLPATIIREDERTIAFMDLAPGTRGHCLVIPRAHAADLGAIDPADLAAVGGEATHCARAGHIGDPHVAGLVDGQGPHAGGARVDGDHHGRAGAGMGGRGHGR